VRLELSDGNRVIVAKGPLHVAESLFNMTKEDLFEHDCDPEFYDYAARDCAGVPVLVRLTPSDGEEQQLLELHHADIPSCCEQLVKMINEYR
jgi:hypothetical protein